MKILVESFDFNSLVNLFMPVTFRNLNATLVLLIKISLQFILSGFMEWQIMFFMSFG